MQATARRVRSPGVVYAALSVALVVVLTAVALTTRQPPPPTIAEFAPQALEQIRAAPAEQSSSFGSASLQGGGGAVAARARQRHISASVIDVARVRRCVGNPPRQIEDPQSPPCVPYWHGDNGGSTYRGVTRDSIRIAIPTEADDNRKKTLWEPLRKFFNSRFEFYGRQLEFVYGRTDLGTANPDTQRSEAQSFAAQSKVFASTFYRASQGFYYHEELSHLKVVNATGMLYPFDASYLRQWQPYMWEYFMSADEMFANLGEWGCKRLAGRNAEYGGSDVSAGRRVFGIILQTYYDGDKTDVAPLQRGLAACGQTVPKERVVRNGVRNDQGGESTQPVAVDPVTSTNVILQMKRQKVTSIFCPCNLFTIGALMKAADQQAYTPEWMVSSYGPFDVEVSPTLGAAPATQMRHAFGLTFQPRVVRPQEEPYWQAVQEAAPGTNQSGDSASVGNRFEIYRPLLLLAAGIQMAGPHLTPATLERGLQSTVFPNPLTPTMAGAVGFRPDRRAMTLDGAEFWWLPGGPSPYTGGDPAVMCYTDGGRRHALGGWVAGRGRLFAGDCDSGA